jgi:penicillin-binding protein 1C
LAFAQPSATPDSFEAFRTRHVPSDRVLLDRHGVPLAALRVDATVRRGAWVALGDVSPAVIEAVTVAEDQRFFEHGGVDWLAGAAALRDRLLDDNSRRGASTLSMQMAAMLDPALARPGEGAPRSLEQKWRQMQAAQVLEGRWSKAQILEAWLNTVGFRGELQGLEAASRGLFGKAPSGLDKAESALLAALVRGPSAAPDKVAARACAILATIRPHTRCDAIERRQLAETLRTPARGAPMPHAALAPHAARRLLGRAEGGGGDAKTWPEGQRSSLDATIQRLARDALRSQLASLARQGAEDGAVVVLDNRSGAVLAYVGSSGAALSRAAGVDAAAAPRQAGSTLKPFLFALAFEQQRLTPATLLDDSPVALPTDAGLYVPRNYAERFEGPVSVRRALAGSLNLPAVRAVTLTGVPPLHRLLRGLGLDTLHPDPQHHGPALALGAADVSLLALSNAYRALANGGVAGAVRWVADEEDSQDSPATGRRVLSPETAWLVSDILADNRARAGSFGFDSVLATPVWAAVKTGTSKDMRDNWCIGFTRAYTVGVWVGNAAGAPMRNVSGVSAAAPAWAQIVAALHQGLPSPPPPAPAGLVAREMVFDGAAEAGRREWFIAATVPAGSASPWPVAAWPESSGTARIVQPSDGAVVAWDPDIPPAMQAVTLRAEGVATASRWRVDGTVLPASDADGRAVLPLAALAPGRHWIELLDADGRLLDRARFELRGVPPAARVAAQ